MRQVIIAGRIDPIKIKSFDNTGKTSTPAYYMGSNLGLCDKNVKNLTFGNNITNMVQEMIAIAWKARMT